MEYEIITPHDEGYMKADSHEVAVVAIILVGRGWYGLRQVDGDFEAPILAFGAGWCKETFGQTVQELHDSIDRDALKKALLSFHLKGERSSMTDFVSYAHAMADQISDNGDEQVKGNTETDFLKERDAYLGMKSELLPEHRGKFAAIYEGRLIAVDKDKIKLIERVRKELGPVRAFIQKIEDDEPQVRLPTSRRLLTSAL